MSSGLRPIGDGIPKITELALQRSNHTEPVSATQPFGMPTPDAPLTKASAEQVKTNLEKKLSEHPDLKSLFANQKQGIIDVGGKKCVSLWLWL